MFVEDSTNAYKYKVCKSRLIFLDGILAVTATFNCFLAGYKQLEF